MVDRTEAEQVVLSFIARVNAHDAHAIIAMCTPDHVFVDTLGSRLSGHRRLENGWLSYFSMFPDYSIEVGGMASSGSLVLACGFAAGTHGRSGAAWRIPAAWRASVLGDRLAEWQVYADNKPVYEILSASA